MVNRLTEFRARNYLLLSEASLRLGSGMCVFTGETGAGKSILLEAMQGLFAPRLSPDLIRGGCQAAYLEGSFEHGPRVEDWLQEHEIDTSEAPGCLTVSRELSLRGSRAKLNGLPIAAKCLPELAELLTEIHAQSGQNQILQPRHQLALLDRYANLDTNDYSQCYRHWQNLRKHIRDREEHASSRERERDYLEFQLRELDDSGPEDAEEESRIRGQLQTIEQLELAQQAQSTLGSECDLSALDRVSRLLGKLAAQDDTISRNLERLEAARLELEDSREELLSRLRTLGDTEVDLDSLNERLGELQKLRRKHGCSDCEALLRHREELRHQRDELASTSDNLEQDRRHCEETEQELRRRCQELTQARQRAASKLSSELTEKLPGLGMEGSELVVAVEALSELGPQGQDRVEFRLRPDARNNALPLGQIASGGELSRLSLLLRAELGSDGRVLFFDEIDAGTSGRVSKLIGRKLLELSRQQQLICVTHQPLVAAYGDEHYRVRKHVHNGSGKTVYLEEMASEEQRIDALGELMSPETATISVQSYAKEIKNHADRDKESFSQRELTSADSRANPAH